MAQAHTDFFAGARAEHLSEAATVARLEALARLLDGALLIPGTNQRVGLDAIVGLVPVLGSAATAVVSAYIIMEARRLGLPRWKVARMIGNLALGGVRILKEGKPLETPEAELNEAVRLATGFSEKLLPMLKALRIQC